MGQLPRPRAPGQRSFTGSISASGSERLSARVCACEIRAQVRTAQYPSPSCPSPIQGSGEGRRVPEVCCSSRQHVIGGKKAAIADGLAVIPARIVLDTYPSSHPLTRPSLPESRCGLGSEWVCSPPTRSRRRFKPCLGLRANPPRQSPYRSCVPVPEGRTQDRRWLLWEAVGHPEPLLPRGAHQPNKQLTRGQRHRPSDPETQDTL